MDVTNVRKYVGKKVLLELKNGYKFTAIIPDFSGESFEIVDKFGQNASIECAMISFIYEKDSKEDDKDGEKRA